MLELIPSNTKIDFLGKGKIAIFVSSLIIIGSVYLWFKGGEAKYGVDYKGGHEILVRVPNDIGPDAIRQTLNDKGMHEALVQSFEAGTGEYSIRLGGINTNTSPGDSKLVRDQIESALKEKAPTVEILKADYVGPTVGGELRRQAMIAVFLGVLGILAYVTIRFEFSFALGAVVALIHDVIVAMGVYLLMGKLISVDVLAAALTIIGYSVNDTIVVFDRVREEIHKQQKGYDLIGLINHCINLTLSRTVITHLLTFFSALGLYIFGGGEIEDLSLFLLVGIVAGTYSTVFIAAPVALWWEDFRSSVETRAVRKA